jgi:hypothetical protein
MGDRLCSAMQRAINADEKHTLTVASKKLGTRNLKMSQL